MLKSFLLALIIVSSFLGLAQKKRWTSNNGSTTKKSLATSYYTRNKVKGSKSYLVKKHYLDYDTPFEEITFLTKKLLIKNGPYNSYYKNGNLKTKGIFTNNLKENIWETFYENNKISNTSTYKNNTLHGNYIDYKRNGNIETGSYNNGEKNALWSYTNEQNQLTKTVSYSKGLREGKTTLYHANGNKKEVKLFKANKLIDTKYFDEEGNEIIKELIEDEVIYAIVEDLPEFPGGTGAMMKFLSRNVNYPPQAIDNNIQGRAYIGFIVEKNGEITHAESVAPPGRGVHKLLIKEAIRVVESMPTWKPGMQRGKPVRVKFTVPINFTIR